MEWSAEQQAAVDKMKNGCILCGDVGSGKSRTALVYYFVVECGGSFEPSYSPMEWPKDLYIITTAKKRDSHEWEKELSPFLLTTNKELNPYDINIVIDSWNNIQKYVHVKNAFFIFDEQRVVGTGAWVKAFYQITASQYYTRKPNGNHWILLSATPGDCWKDYIPVFVANHFYSNKTDFMDQHAIYDRYSKYPKINDYLNERRLIRLRDSILVDIAFHKNTMRHYADIIVDYDKPLFKAVAKNRWDPYKDEPIAQIAGLFYILRRIVNENDEKIDSVKELIATHSRVIVFYNFDYELEMLRKMCNEMDIVYSEWNGHMHQEIPEGDTWVYLVQYSSGCEGWNCIETNTMIFFSLNYSYRMTMQACGRIDRRNTKYVDLYYYFIRTDSWIDKAIKRAFAMKKDFNEGAFKSKFFNS